MSTENPITNVTRETLETWATDAAGPVALTLTQRLVSVEGEGAVIFPPTYADIGYNIDELADGTRVATIDSVGSQANRLEPLFRPKSDKPEDWLVPPIEVVLRAEPCGQCEACEKSSEGTKKKARTTACKAPRKVKRSLLDLAHRAADAVVLSSPTLAPLVSKAFASLQQGDAGPLCTLAPTSLVFGVWDSRGDSNEKRPRLVRSIIRAWEVETLHAAAQFNSVWKALDEEQKEELEREAKSKKVELSVKGFADAPATFRKTKLQQYLDGAVNPHTRVLGGVLARGRVERRVTVNLVALRTLSGKNEAETVAIRQYLLGLALTAATAEIDLFLREGCHLRYVDDGDEWFAVPRRGKPQPIALAGASDVIQQYTKEAAAHFASEWKKLATENQLEHAFDLKKAKELLKKQDDQDASAST